MIEKRGLRLDEIPGPKASPSSGHSISLSIVTAEKPHEDAFYRSKRIFDLITSSLMLVLLSPVLLMIAILIKLDSPGPVFFVQERAGCRRRRIREGTVWQIRCFGCYKFRSMAQNADPSRHERYIQDFCQSRPAAEHGDGTTFKLQSDPRVTRFGRVLRRSSLDELPQFINVLRGEMSLVGPRPVPFYEVAQYEKSDYERLAATPGITGLWQVRGRGRVPFQEMMRMDIEYVRQRSWGLDLKLLLLTIPAVIFGRGAA